MKTSIKNSLHAYEEALEVPERTRAVLAQKLFSRKAPRYVLWLSACVVGASAFFFAHIESAQAPFLGVQEVLAQTLASSTALPEQGLLAITRTVTDASGTPFQRTETWSDGTHVWTRNADASGKVLWDSWTQKQPDGTVYEATASYDPFTLQKDIAHEGEITMPDQALFWNHASTPDSASACSVDDITCLNISLPQEIIEDAQSIVLLDADTSSDYYHVVIESASDSSFATRHALKSLTRELFIDKETFRLMRRTWHAVFADGSPDAQGEMTYTYEVIHDLPFAGTFSFDGWKEYVDPQKEAELSCLFYGVPCEEVENLPEGWTWE